jgi:hypothetical protein
MKRLSVIAAVAVLGLLAARAPAAELSFGGDLKFHLFDMSTGSSGFMELDSLGSPEFHTYDTTDRWDIGFERAYLYFVAQLTDKFTIDIEPEIVARSGATPSLGMKIGSQRVPASDADAVTLGFNAAKVSALVPWNVQVSAGILRPLFTEDYGDMKGFMESVHYAKSQANPWLGAWHDAGIEVYKAFEFQLGEQYLTLPAYLYLLNGGTQASDNNSNKTVMLHVAPEFWKFRLLGSFALGKWDDAGRNDVMRYVAGLSGELGPVWVRGEYVGGKWDGEEFVRSYDPMVVDTFAAKPFGYYAKLGVNFIPDKLSLILDYDYAQHNFGGFLFVGDDHNIEKYTTVTGTLCWSVIPGSSVMLGVSKAMWSSTTDAGAEIAKLDYLRPTLGWRTVF